MKEGTIDEGEIINYIREKKKVLDGIVITGGEPSLHMNELIKFIKKIKKEFPSFSIKVDTNGSSKKFIKEIIPIVDFIAIDFKGTDYGIFSECDTEIILENITLLDDYVQNNYEIRITMYPDYVKEEDFLKIAELLKGKKRVIIQQYRKNNDSDPAPYKKEILSKFSYILKDYVKYVDIRE